MNNIDTFIDYLKTRQFSKGTIRTACVSINIYLAWVAQERIEAEQIRYQDLLGFMKFCRKKGMTQKSIKHYLNTVRHYYNHLIDEGLMVTNPTTGLVVKGIKRRALYHILETHQLHELYNRYPDQTYRDKRNKIMLGLLVYQGIRTEELGRLTIKDIKLREGKVDVLGSRNNNGRLLQLEAHQVLDMYDYILKTRLEILGMNPKRKSQQKVETDQLFISEGGNCYSVSNFMTQLVIKVRKVNSSVVNAKQIRASVITKWVKQYNLRKAQYLAGHRYISSTESYLQNDIEGLKEEVLKYHPLG